jgi:competence protein ComEC
MSAATERAVRPSVRAVLDEQFGGFLLESHDQPRNLSPARARLFLVEDAARREDVVTLRVRVAALEIRGRWRAVKGGAAITVAGTVRESDRRRWHAGTELEAAVTFRRPPTYLNDGVPDAELGRALRGVSVVGTVKSGLLVGVRNPGSRLARASATARQAIRDAVRRSVGAGGQTAAAVVTAVLIGDESGLSPELRDRWQAAGTYHVLAISGGNIAVVVALIVVLSSMTGAGPRPSAVLALGALAAFAGVVTPGSSVQRASLMAAVHLGARALDHRATSWQALAATLAAMVTVDPLGLHDVGLLLTCGATLALIECARYMGRVGTGHPLRWLLMAVTATACVELVVFPIQVWWFSRLSFAGLALNLIAVPLMTVAQVAGLLAVALDLGGASAAPAGWIASQAVRLLDECVELVEWVPWTARMTPRPPAWLVVAYYASLVWWWGSRATPRWLMAVALAASGLAIAAGQPMPPARLPPSSMRLTMMDVGQGESLLVEDGGWRALIDAGGRPFGEGMDIGRRVVVPALWARGVTALDALVITHPDPDHIGGAGAVVEAMAVRELWLGVRMPGHELSEELLRQVASARTRVIDRRAGEALRHGRARIRVLHPAPPDWERRHVRNDDSVVLEIVHGDVAVLLLGDVGADVERAIVRHLTPARVRILKVGHHGSRTSTSPALVDAWRPDIALISCGRGNSFGHPAPAVLARLQASGAAVFRTDTNGQITVRSDGRQAWVETFRGHRAWVRPAL